MPNTNRPQSDAKPQSAGQTVRTLIQIQDEALAKLDTTRSSARRYLKWQGSVHRWYRAEIAKIGIVDTFPTYTARATWRDVLDIASLHKGCGE